MIDRLDLKHTRESSIFNADEEEEKTIKKDSFSSYSYRERSSTDFYFQRLSRSVGLERRKKHQVVASSLHEKRGKSKRRLSHRLNLLVHSSS